MKNKTKRSPWQCQKREFIAYRNSAHVLSCSDATPWKPTILHPKCRESQLVYVPCLTWLFFRILWRFVNHRLKWRLDSMFFADEKYVLIQPNVTTCIAPAKASLLAVRGWLPFLYSNYVGVGDFDTLVAWAKLPVRRPALNCQVTFYSGFMKVREDKTLVFTIRVWCDQLS